MAKKVIDVSHHNGTIDWESVKAAGIDGAIIRCGFGSDIASQDDEQWKRNADECTRLGIPFGVYLYSYATTNSMAKSEVEHVLRLIKGYKLSYPVYYDLEEDGTESGAAERARIFCEAIEAAGYWAGVYANKNWWDNYLARLNEYTRWVARYNSTLGMDNVDMWQYTSGGSVPGISGRVDMNHCYRDFPKEITGFSGGSGESGSSSGGGNSGSTYTGNSLVDYLKSIGKDSSFAVRKQYAAQYGISNYSGTAAQNTQLLNLMRGGSAPEDSSYYQAFSNASLVDGLKSIGVDSSFTYRQKIAAANGIGNYSGTASQNTTLCNLAKQGKLKKA